MQGIDFDPLKIISLVVVGFFAIGLHEYAHCKFADMAGDPTPGIYGRVTLNLTKHFDPLGTVMMFVTALTGYGMGWGKPAPINPEKMRNPRWDTFIAVAAGPLSNLVQAVIWALIARLLVLAHVIDLQSIFLGQAGMDVQEIGRTPNLLATLLFTGVALNVSLALFNLFPIPPLDGHWLVGLLLPEKPRGFWFLYCRRYGFYIIWGFVLLANVAPALSIFRLAAPVLQSAICLLFGFPTEWFQQ